MRFSDTTHFYFLKQMKYANSDSSPFNADESPSDEDSPQTFMTPSITCNQNTLQPSNQNSPQTSKTPFVTSNQESITPSSNDNPPFKQIINTPQTNIPIDRSRHPSRDQSKSFPPPKDRTTKTHYK